MRFLISSLDGVYGGFPRHLIGGRSPRCSLNTGDEYFMSEGLGIFETATRELRAMHDESNLKKLGKVSGDYYWAEQEIDRLQQELAATLSKDAVEKLNKLRKILRGKKRLLARYSINKALLMA